MEKDILNIAINGDEKNRNEIVYNNVVGAMDNLKMSKDEQIEYLKTKVSTIESEYHSNLILLLLILLSIVLVSVGLYLVAIDLYILGTIITLVGFIIIAIKLLLTVRKNNIIRNKKYIEIESLRNNLSSVLK